MDIIVSNNRAFLRSHKKLTLPDCAVIACTSSMFIPEQFDTYADSRKLILSFDDIEDVKHINAFTQEQANQIKIRVNKWLSRKVEEIYICCDSGESRSAAIAAAIRRYLERKRRKYIIKISPKEKDIWANPHYHPNILVYDLMCKAFHMKTTKLGLFIRKRTSRNALRKAIRESRG